MPLLSLYQIKPVKRLKKTGPKREPGFSTTNPESDSGLEAGDETCLQTLGAGNRREGQRADAVALRSGSAHAVQIRVVGLNLFGAPVAGDREGRASRVVHDGCAVDFHGISNQKVLSYATGEKHIVSLQNPYTSNSQKI
jgi:hypothetical protein